MAKTKFYAIKTKTSACIVTTWEECEKLTHGVKGVIFKSFSSLEDAKRFLDDSIPEKAQQGIQIYVDGSFSPKSPYSGWAFIAIENGTEIKRQCGITKFPAESRNIDGELAASFYAMKFLDSIDKTGIIFHDYEGIARFAKGEWKPKSPIALKYVNAIAPYVHRVHFQKVEAHTGDKWNELVDSLAKKAIEIALDKKSGK